MSKLSATRPELGALKKVRAKSTRTQKIQYSSRRLSDYSLRLTPSLVLSGVWFQQAGFWIGDVVNIEIGEGQITISNSLPF
jgi:hypothetical protein